MKKAFTCVALVLLLMGLSACGKKVITEDFMYSVPQQTEKAQ